jgi:hypothetical protein
MNDRVVLQNERGYITVRVVAVINIAQYRMVSIPQRILSDRFIVVPAAA